VQILLAHNRYRQPGGEDIVFEAETTLLRSHGHEVVQYVEDNTQIHSFTVPRVAVSAIWSHRAVRRLRSLLAEYRPDLVHFHNTFPLISPAAYVACRSAGVPVVQTLHNYRLICPNGLLFRDGHHCEDCFNRPVAWPGVLHACYRQSRLQTAAVAAMLAVHRVRGTWTQDVNVYVALTSFARHKFIEAGFPEEKILVKPNFVDPDPGSEPGERRFFLFVGRLSEEKGIRTLLRAWAGLDPSMQLRVVGAGPLEPLVREAADASSSISYLGPLSRAGVFEQMRSAHALLFPSEWYEALPVTLLEAFACARPVIAADQGAAAEVVTHGRTGLLFRPGDEQALREQVNWAADHSDELASMGAGARREYEGRYTAQASYSRLLDIYQLAMCSATPQPSSSQTGR